VTFFQEIKKLFTKPVTVPLPEWDGIKQADIPPASIILFYGGNKLTQLIGNRLYGHPYNPPAFHAAFYIGDPEAGLFLNVGAFRTLQYLKDEFKSTRRIDIVTVKNLTSAQRKRLCAKALLDTSKPHAGIEFPDYAITDYLRFGFRFLKPSKKEFCSENVCDLFASEGVSISANKAVDTAPWDLEEFAETHREDFQMFTAWRGVDFKS
jgi:hypothetical protein